MQLQFANISQNYFFPHHSDLLVLQVSGVSTSSAKGARRSAEGEATSGSEWFYLIIEFDILNL